MIFSWCSILKGWVIVCYYAVEQVVKKKKEKKKKKKEVVLTYDAQKCNLHC